VFITTSLPPRAIRSLARRPGRRLGILFLLKGARPQTFRDYYRELNVHSQLDQRVTVNVVHEFRDSPASQLTPPDAPRHLPPSTLDHDQE
jgi:hypothetical protein